MSSLLQTVLLFALLSGIVDSCGNVATTNGTDRKRRDVFGSDVVQIELQTTLTSAGDVEFARVEETVGPAYGELIASSHRQVATGVDGEAVLKYLMSNVDCGEAQLFARAVKDTTSFVTGAVVRCNDQVSSI